MKRARTILGWLLVGAVVNVLVAWGCALLVDAASRDPSVGVRITESTSRELIRQRAFGSTLIMGSHGRGDFSGSVHEYGDDPAIWDVGWGQFDHPSQRFLALAETFNGTVIEDKLGVANGWPFRSLWYTSFQFIRGHDDLNADTSSGGIVTPFPPRRYIGPRVLPLRPIAFGFLMNTFVYALFLGALFHGTIAWKLNRRRKRGQCLACAHDLQGVDHDACPECGAVVATGGRA